MRANHFKAGSGERPSKNRDDHVAAGTRSATGDTGERLGSLSANRVKNAATGEKATISAANRSRCAKRPANPSPI